jgi:hypothetical protein
MLIQPPVFSAVGGSGSSRPEAHRGPAVQCVVWLLGGGEWLVCAEQLFELGDLGGQSCDLLLLAL